MSSSVAIPCSGRDQFVGRKARSKILVGRTLLVALTACGILERQLHSLAWAIGGTAPVSASLSTRSSQRLQDVFQHAASASTVILTRDSSTVSTSDTFQQAEKQFKDAAQAYLETVQGEFIANLEQFNEYNIYMLLSRFGPRARMIQPMLPRALAAIVPQLSDEALGKLVLMMAYSEVRQAPAWEVLCAGVIKACSAGSSEPKQLAEWAFGFSWISYSRAELFGSLQSRMNDVQSQASDEERRVFSWACAHVGQPCTHVFGDVSNDVDANVASTVWDSLREMMNVE